MVEPVVPSFNLPPESAHFVALPIAFGIITFFHITVGERVPAGHSKITTHRIVGQHAIAQILQNIPAVHPAVKRQQPHYAQSRRCASGL